MSVDPVFPLSEADIDAINFVRVSWKEQNEKSVQYPRANPDRQLVSCIHHSGIPRRS